MNPGAGDEFPQYPPGFIYPLPGSYMFNDRGNPSPSPSVTSTDSLPESPQLSQFSENSSMPASTSTCSRRTSSSPENKKAQDRWGKEEEKLLVHLWAEKHEQLESRKSRKTWAWINEKISKMLGKSREIASRTQHGVVLVHRFCSQVRL